MDKWISFPRKAGQTGGLSDRLPIAQALSHQSQAFKKALACGVCLQLSRAPLCTCLSSFHWERKSSVHLLSGATWPEHRPGPNLTRQSYLPLPMPPRAIPWMDEGLYSDAENWAPIELALISTSVCAVSTHLENQYGSWVWLSMLFPLVD